MVWSKGDLIWMIDVGMCKCGKEDVVVPAIL